MDAVSGNDLLRRLAFDNPWWDAKPGTPIRFRQLPKRPFFAPFSARVRAMGMGRALLLAGPLRAGKTVLLRQALAGLIESGARPESVLYCSFATPSYGAADFPALVDAFCRRHKHAPSAELFLFLDDIEYAPDFEALLLKLARQYPHAHVVGAASALAPALYSGATTKGGRLEIFVLPPLTFAEHLRLRGAEDDLFADAGKTGGAAALKAGALPRLDLEFQYYVNFGGFPEGAGGKPGMAPSPAFVRDRLADRVLRNDRAGLAGVADAGELGRLLLVLARDSGREGGIDDIAGAAGVAKNTLRKYLDYLEHAFLIRRIERLDHDGGRFQRAVAFKTCLAAPSLYAALFGPVAATEESFARLAETALIAQWLGSPDARHLAYASWRGGKVDLVALDPQSGKPAMTFEIDWTDAYAKGAGVKGPAAMVGFIEKTNPKAKAFVLTRAAARPARMRGIDVTLVPLSLYAYWAGRNTIARLEKAPATATPQTQGAIQGEPQAAD